MEMFKTLTSVLLAGDNTIEFTDSNITDSSILDCYLTDSELIIEESSQTGTTVSITVSNHTEPVGVALFINNCDNFKPYDDTDVQNELLQLNTRVSLLENSMNDKQDKLTAGENITIENNVISASGGSGSTNIYSDTETVIGTYFGKNLYRKCFTNLSITIPRADTWVNLVNISNVDKVVNSNIFYSDRFELKSYELTIDGTQVKAEFGYLGATRAVNRVIIEYTKAGE